MWKFCTLDFFTLPAEELDLRSFNLLEIVYTKICLQSVLQAGVRMQRYQGCHTCAYMKKRAGVHPFCVEHCPGVLTPIKSFDPSEHFWIHRWLAGLLKNKLCSREYLQDWAIKLLLWFTFFRGICQLARITLSECTGQKWNLHLFHLRSFSPRIIKAIKLGSALILVCYWPTTQHVCACTPDIQVCMWNWYTRSPSSEGSLPEYHSEFVLSCPVLNCN